MSKYYLVPLTGYYAGQYAVVGDSPYAIKTDLNPIEAYALRDRMNGVADSPWCQGVSHDD